MICPQFTLKIFADPLCCWSWALAAELRRLEAQRKESLKIELKMGVMIESWSRFSDPLNNIFRPAQMAPYWDFIGRQCGRPITGKVWLDDPPGSSIPAALAVKSAQQQSESAGQHFLEILHEAVMIDGKNIAKEEILSELADRAAKQGVLDFDQMISKISAPETVYSLRCDMQQAAAHRIGRFPAILAEQSTHPPSKMLMIGFRPAEVIWHSLNLDPKKLPSTVQPAESQPG
ncbi:MAG: DsbA family protein [Deltaproteobacteria bacterium]|nr:DsbA family protein [Deltaproteobacteria bacterium]